LYYSNDGFQSASNVAITKDGEIVANFITTGILGDKGMGSTTNWWNMDTGVMNLIGGKTSISGDCIKTGTISANRIDVTGIFAQNITASGTLTGLAINGGTITGSKLLFTINGSTCATAETGTIEIPSWSQSITITGLKFTGSTLFDVNNFGVNTNECIFRSGNATLEMTPGKLQILTWGTGNAANSLTMASDYSDFGCNNGRTSIYATTNLELSGENIIMRNNVSHYGGTPRTIYFDSGYVRYN
jgi:hypothetical protein